MPMRRRLRRGKAWTMHPNTQDEATEAASSSSETATSKPARHRALLVALHDGDRVHLGAWTTIVVTLAW